MKFLLVAFDGLRPDMITPDLMPNLFEFSSQAAVFENHRCVFPSETYVNTTSLVTGTVPATHGIVANFFLDPHVDPREPFAGFSVPSIEKAQQAYQGRLFTVPSAGELLGDAGRRLAVLSTNSAGSARLKHHRVHDYAHLNLCCHSPETSFPQSEIDAIITKFGRLSEKTVPDLDGVTYVTNVFLDDLAAKELPDLTMLWYGEPDNTYHAFGIGSPENLQALRHSDEEFSRVFDWWLSKGLYEGIQLLVVSDHAHITQQHKVSVGNYLTQCGFSVDRHLEDGADVALIPGYSGNLLVQDHAPDRIAAVAEALTDWDCMGLVFTRSKNGNKGGISATLAMELLLSEHPRSPDIAFVLASDDTANAFGYPGTCYFDSEFVPLGGGIHGGLHPLELNCVCMARGSFFQEETRISTYSGIVDILPTILTGLGLPIPEHVSGRILSEVLQYWGTQEIPARNETFESSNGYFHQVLNRVRIGESVYLKSGCRI
jgi:hypothetical protein